MTSFVGRRRELSETRALLSSSRLLTLTGAPGVGKTRLALRLATTSRGYPDGLWLVDLATLQDGELLIPTVAGALGIGDRPGASPLDQLCSYLADKRLLLILDNCAHLVRACAALASRLLEAAPHLRILATSREALAIEGERLYTVSPLSLPDPDAPATFSLSEAMNLFVERAQAILPGFQVTEDNREAVAALCRRLDGIPLALELAAVQVRVLPVEDIVRRLDDGFRLLARGSRAAPPKHRTLRAAIEWSYALCSPAEQVLWQRMSVFAGSCGVEAIEQVCSGDGIAVEDVCGLLLGLVTKSIVARAHEAGRTRYRLLRTVREFGQEVLAASGGDVAALRARHCDYFRRQTRRPGWFGPCDLDWLDWMRLEWPNLRAALEFAFTEPGWAPAGLEILADTYHLWTITGALREGRQWLERALRLNPEPTVTRGRVLQAYGFVLILLGDTDTALKVLRECRELGERLNDESVLAYAALRAGSATMYQGDVQGALALLEEALERSRGLGDPLAVYTSLRNLAMAAAADDDPRAEPAAWECLRLCEAHGAVLAKSWALWVIGLVRWRKGDVAEAVAHFRESLRLKVDIGDLAGQAHGLGALAWVAVGEGEMVRAARLFGAAHRVWRQVGSALIVYGYVHRFSAPALERARGALGDSFDAYFGEGEKMDAADAARLALGEQMTHPKAMSSMAALDGEPSLTPREREIAGLVGEGMSNKEIAGRLIIAQRTAEGHVQRILAKLGFTSRAQIAAWVVKNDS